MTDFVERLKQALQRRPPVTQGQMDQERETGVSLGLMGEAEASGAAMTPEQQIFLSQSEHGMRERLSVLLGIPHRSLAQEREKLAIEGWLGRNSPPVAAPSPPRRLGLLGPAMASPALSILLSPWTWMVALAAFALVQMGLKERIENQRDEALEAARENYEAAERWRERSEEYRQGLVDAANVAREAAAALEGERRRQSAAAARERRRNREIANVLAGSPEPPDWRLREPEPPEESGSAAPGP